MKFHCPNCNQRIEADVSYIGKHVNCPSCKHHFLVSDPRPQKPRVIREDPISQTLDRRRVINVEESTDEPKKQPKKKFSKFQVTLCVFLILTISFRLFCGIFVIQPIGVIPDGVTIIYFRSGLNTPFISSADSIQKKKTGRVSLLGRGIVLVNISKELKGRKIMSLPYIHYLYLQSTNGAKYKQ